jgi:hypothetical protein
MPLSWGREIGNLTTRIRGLEKGKTYSMWYARERSATATSNCSYLGSCFYTHSHSGKHGSWFNSLCGRGWIAQAANTREQHQITKNSECLHIVITHFVHETKISWTTTTISELTISHPIFQGRIHEMWLMDGFMHIPNNNPNKWASKKLAIKTTPNSTSQQNKNLGSKASLAATT